MNAHLLVVKVFPYCFVFFNIQVILVQKRLFIFNNVCHIQEKLLLTSKEYL